MKAARWHGRGDVRVEDVPEPTPALDEVVVAVEWCGICGTDLEEYRAGPVAIPVAEPHPLTGQRAPLTLGHEIVGRVVEPASDGTGPQAGMRVIPDVVIGCGACWWCRRHQEGLCERGAVIGLHRDGGLAEYVAAPAASCVAVPDSLPADAAALAEPTACAVRALRKVPDPIGSTLLVVGAGTIGLIVAQVARAMGLRTVIAVEPEAGRRELALALGADAALEPAETEDSLPELTGGIGPDVVIECSGARGAAAEGIRLARRGGTVVLVGFHGQPEPFDLLDAVVGEKRILGSAAHLWDEDVAVAVDLIARGAVDAGRIITTRIPLEDVVAAGFGALEDHTSGALKVLVQPTPAGGPDGGAGR